MTRNKSLKMDEQQQKTILLTLSNECKLICMELSMQKLKIEETEHLLKTLYETANKQQHALTNLLIKLDSMEIDSSSHLRAFKRQIIHDVTS